jgi:hypothetical protein
MTLLKLRTSVRSARFGLPNVVDQSASGRATVAPVAVPSTASCKVSMNAERDRRDQI